MYPWSKPCISPYHAFVALAITFIEFINAFVDNGAQGFKRDFSLKGLDVRRDNIRTTNSSARRVDNDNGGARKQYSKILNFTHNAEFTIAERCFFKTVDASTSSFTAAC